MNMGASKRRDIASYAWDLGLELGMELEAEYFANGMLIEAFEIQTGIQLSDLPRMTEDGVWVSWEDTLKGLGEFKNEFQPAFQQSSGGFPCDKRD